jgi:hypothetical protein
VPEVGHPATGGRTLACSALLRAGTPHLQAETKVCQSGSLCARRLPRQAGCASFVGSKLRHDHSPALYTLDCARSILRWLPRGAPHSRARAPVDGDAGPSMPQRTKRSTPGAGWPCHQGPNRRAASAVHEPSVGGAARPSGLLARSLAAADRIHVPSRARLAPRSLAGTR